MQWISDYQLFLFDLDGLLVNTEELHYRAYQQMCQNRGAPLQWDFSRYCQAAHYHSDTLREEIYRACPALKALDWKELYAEKQTEIKKLLGSGAVHLMPGAAELLKQLKAAGIQHAVVTHSSDDLVAIIRREHKILDAIPNWITRHHYTNPKPHPECYLKAIELLAKNGDRVVGFEDSPRGMNALLGSSAKPILICKAEYPEIPEFVEKGVLRFRSFEELLSLDKLP